MEVGDRARIGLGALVTLLMVFSPAWATPTFQTYISGGTAGDVGADGETWITHSGTFNLVVVGAYSSKTSALTWGTLIVSVPQGETGTLTIGGATLLTAARDTGVGDLPDGPAGLDLLSNAPGADGYENKSPVLDLNNHFPYQNDEANFFYYAVGDGDFANLGPIHNYNAGDGSITLEGSGEEKELPVSVSGFSWVHFDLGGYVDNEPGHDAWDINPGSHDATADPVVPVPGSLLLAALGAGLVGHIRRRKAL